MKYRVVLFQPYLRQFVLNFGKVLKEGEFISTATPPSRTLYNILPTFEKEIERMKTRQWRYRLRRILGIPNVRFRYEKKGDILFTYGTVLLTNKPYCAYLETGLSFYNYDRGIGQHPLARLIVSILTLQRKCHKIIFLSEAAKKSFFTSVWYPEFIRKRLEKKMAVIYPLPLLDTGNPIPKVFKEKLKVLFVGMYYMKGGVELVKAFQRLRLHWQNVELSIVTPVHTLRKEDMEALQKIEGLHLIDAKLGAEEMRALYREHDVFCLPTYRDGFGLVLIEALAYGMPIITTDQYATSEMVDVGKNGFIFYNHPLQDYNPQTYQIFGKYYNPKVFYNHLFQLQREGKMQPVEDFLYQSIEQFLVQKELLETFSRHSIELYQKKFHPEKIGNQLETIFLNAFQKDNKSS